MTAVSKPTGRPVRCSVAMSLDGYIAGPNGEYDWIIMDPTIDFAEMFARYDTFLLGRKTFEAHGTEMMTGSSVVVFSRTLTSADHPEVRIVGEGARGVVEELKRKPGKDIWLFGGGELFRSLLADQVVDELEVAIVPVLLGAGLPLLPSPATGALLELKGSRTYPTGILFVQYAVRYPAPQQRARDSERGHGAKPLE